MFYGDVTWVISGRLLWSSRQFPRRDCVTRGHPSWPQRGRHLPSAATSRRCRLTNLFLITAFLSTYDQRSFSLSPARLIALFWVISAHLHGNSLILMFVPQKNNKILYHIISAVAFICICTVEARRDLKASRKPWKTAGQPIHIPIDGKHWRELLPTLSNSLMAVRVKHVL